MTQQEIEAKIRSDLERLSEELKRGDEALCHSCNNQKKTCPLHPNRYVMCVWCDWLGALTVDPKTTCPHMCGGPGIKERTTA